MVCIAFFAACRHIAENEFSEQNLFSDLLLSKIVRRTYDRIFQEHEKFVFNGYQQLADIV